MKLKYLLLSTLPAITFFSCAGTPRILQVHTEPADAQVCIKGKAGSKYLSNDKQCIGSTPFEADKIQVTDTNGRKRWINFKDVEADKEKFYLVVNREGYEPVALNVPEWEHHLKLKPELQKGVAVLEEKKEVADSGALKVSSNPVGALIYVNDSLKGNTPFTIDGHGGDIVKIKLEQTGFAAVEKTVTIETGKTMEINLIMETKEQGVSLNTHEQTKVSQNH